MRTAERLWALSWLCLAAGCSTGLNWKTVVERDAPTVYAFQGETVWGFGAGTVLRRDPNGTWERVELCGDYAMSTYYTSTKLAVNLAFEGDAVWALCGDNTIYDRQTLIRHDGAGNAKVIDLPIEGTVSLVPLAQGAPAILGTYELYLWNGSGWDAKGPLLANGQAVGVSADEIYVRGQQEIVYWNGATWGPVAGSSTQLPLTLRLGKAWSGSNSLEAGVLTPLAFEGLASLEAQNLKFASLLSKDKALVTDPGGTEYYVLGVSEPKPQALGAAPFVANTGKTNDVTVVDVYGNQSTVFGSYGDGTGVFVTLGLDEHTMLLGVATNKTGLEHTNNFQNALIEGRF